MSKTKILVHIVFSTHHRQMSINEEHKRDLYNYIFGILKKYNCFLIRLNGMPDHVHMLVDLHPTVAVATLVKAIKQSSSLWLKNNPKFPLFRNWNEGYYAVSVSPEGSDSCKNYIINQEIHHRQVALVDEVKWMSEQNGLTWYADDWN